jgi:DNA-binding CsgD family transcriptional regulator
VLDLVRPALERALGAAQASERLGRALSANAPSGTAVVLLNRCGEIEQSSPHADRWLAEHHGPPEHAGWLPEAVAAWLALPPRPPLVSVRAGRGLTIHLLPGDPHALLLEEDVASIRPDALHRLGLTPREAEVLYAASRIEEEVDIAWELTLSLHAVQGRLARLETKLGVDTAAGAVTEALRAST